MNNSTIASLNKGIASLLVAAFLIPVAQAAPLQQQDPQQPQPTQQQSTPSAQAPASAPNVPAPQLEDPSARQNPVPPDQQNNRPVGTAAAPEANPNGIVASRPAGAVIAPSKQRRVKRIVIRVALIAGAAAAIGVVAGLSRSSSARP